MRTHAEDQFVELPAFGLFVALGWMQFELQPRA